MNPVNFANVSFAEVPLTDAEAEGVLLALGPPLEWKKMKLAGNRHERAVTQDQYYWCLCSGYGPFRRYKSECYIGPKFLAEEARVRCPRRYKTQAEAKSACERYHATGKWEG